MSVRSIDSFKTVPEAIAYYAKLVAECSKSRDYTNIKDMLEFKKQLHDRIESERNREFI